MACGRAVSYVRLDLLACFIFSPGSAALPVVDVNGLSAVSAISSQSTATLSTGLTWRTALISGDHSPHIEIAVTQNNYGATEAGTEVVRTGGLSFAGPLGIGIAAFITAVIMLAVIYSIYYHHAKLRIQRARLERSEPINLPQEREADMNQEAANPTSPPPTETRGVLRRTTTRIPPQMSGCAVLMSSAAELSPTVYSALQSSEEEPKAQISEDAKMRAILQEEKALGRRDDIISDRHSS